MPLATENYLRNNRPLTPDAQNRLNESREAVDSLKADLRKQDAQMQELMEMTKALTAPAPVLELPVQPEAANSSWGSVVPSPVPAPVAQLDYSRESRTSSKGRASGPSPRPSPHRKDSSLLSSVEGKACESPIRAAAAWQGSLRAWPGGPRRVPSRQSSPAHSDYSRWEQHSHPHPRPRPRPQRSSSVQPRLPADTHRSSPSPPSPPSPTPSYAANYAAAHQKNRGSDPPSWREEWQRIHGATPVIMNGGSKGPKPSRGPKQKRKRFDITRTISELQSAVAVAQARDPEGTLDLTPWNPRPQPQPRSVASDWSPGMPLTPSVGPTPSSTPCTKRQHHTPPQRRALHRSQSAEPMGSGCLEPRKETAMLLLVQRDVDEKIAMIAEYQGLMDELQQLNDRKEEINRQSERIQLQFAEVAKGYQRSQLADHGRMKRSRSVSSK